MTQNSDVTINLDAKCRECGHKGTAQKTVGADTGLCLTCARKYILEAAKKGTNMTELSPLAQRIIETVAKATAEIAAIARENATAIALAYEKAEEEFAFQHANDKKEPPMFCFRLPIRAKIADSGKYFEVSAGWGATAKRSSSTAKAKCDHPELFEQGGSGGQ